MWVRPQDHLVVGEYLAATRKEVGVSQDELAARLGKPQSFVSAFERGQRRIDMLELMLIAKALGVDPKKTFAAIVDKSSAWLEEWSPEPTKGGAVTSAAC